MTNEEASARPAELPGTVRSTIDVFNESGDKCTVSYTIMLLLSDVHSTMLIYDYTLRVSKHSSMKRKVTPKTTRSTLSTMLHVSTWLDLPFANQSGVKDVATLKDAAALHRSLR